MDRDLMLDIATGTSRKQKKWKNEKITWGELVDRLASTVRTPETIEDFIKAPKSQQDEIKDVGGFVGGYLNKGSRTDVRHRQLIVLDIDFGTEELFDDLGLIYGCSAVLYSTHKHRPSSPRLRLVMPLNRPVSPEEYEAIARRIANNLDIDAFDDTTYQPQRLMYWPSTSINGEYVYRVHDGHTLDADEVLKEYVDWTNITEWPTSSRTRDVVQKSLKRQGDPLDKEGLIGAFNRAYSITEAIDSFIEDYEPCDMENRYTYIKGSTAGGVVIYDDKFSYSHHSTDPASNQLCNAFDLVRIHKFSDLDEDAKPDTPVTRLPSFKAMQKLASNDENVKVQIYQDSVADFDSYEDAEEKEDKDSLEWVKGLEMDNKGNYKANANNIELILENDPQFKGRFGYNEFACTIEALKDLPWRKVNKMNKQISDSDDSFIRSVLSKRYGIEGKDKIFDAVNIIAVKNSFHPIKKYLESLSWDGTPRIDKLFIEYFNCDDNDYVKAVTRKTLVAAVARIYEPGCKFDYMLTLKGVQGTGKSTFFKRLSKGYFSDNMPDLATKDAKEHLRGVWIIEMAEMATMKKSDENLTKSFLSSQTDRFRMSYGKRTLDYPRQCIFVGTTNEDAILKDYTGNRRFWIIAANDGAPAKDPMYIKDSEFDQMWAEAKALYDEGKEELYLSRELEESAEVYREGFMIVDPREGIIREYLERPITTDWYEKSKYERKQFIQEDAEGTIQRDRVSAIEIWCEALGKREEEIKKYEAAEINSIMSRIKGWEKVTTLRIPGYGTQRGFRRIKKL